MPRSAIAGLHGSFSFLRNCQIVLQSDCAILNSHQHPATCEHSSFSASSPAFGIISIFYLSFLYMCTGVLICLLLIANDVEHLSTCLFAICRASSVKCFLLIFYFDHFTIQLWEFFAISFFTIGSFLSSYRHFCKAKDFEFDVIHFIKFSFSLWWFWYSCQK